MAANLEVGAETRESERDRKFATQTFNSLSKQLIATSLQQAPASEESCLLTNLVQLRGKVVFCCNL